MYVFGGMDLDGIVQPNMYIKIDWTGSVGSPVIVSVPNLPPLYGHRIGKIKYNNTLVFGGSTQYNRPYFIGNTTSFNTSAVSVNIVNPLAPLARFAHTMCTTADNKVILFGGRQDSTIFAGIFDML
jgi:hypothetical protein